MAEQGPFKSEVLGSNPRGRTMKISLYKINWNDNKKTTLLHENDFYLVKIYDRWYAGKFSMQWYGWNFNNWGTSGMQLGSSITEIYLIEESNG